MEPKNHRPKSIDGFHRGDNVNRRPVFRDTNSAPLAKTAYPEVKKPQPTKIPASYAVTQQNKPSLLGMSMPNDSYTQNTARNRGKNKSDKKKWSRKRKVVTTVLTIVIVLVGFFGWFGSRLLGSIDKVFHGNIFSDAQALFSNSNLKESNGRVNILLAGDSADDPGHAGGSLTDSIMVVSIDPKAHTGFMLSVPRDLWVYVPGFNSYQKINAANEVNNFSASGLPSGGMGNLQQIVQNDLGIPIDYEALVNYTALRDAVNSVGGVTININSPDPRGVYDKFTNLKLPNGQVNLTGQEALALSRARGDAPAGDVSYGFPNTDFTRTAYQRQIVVAILKKATSLGVVSNPLKITSLFSSFSNNVKTNLTLPDILALSQVSKGMNFSSLGSYTYSNSVSGDQNPLLVSHLDPSSGQSGLIPAAGIGNYGALKSYFLQLSSNNPAVKENASIDLLNGTNTVGLAKTAQQALQSKGLLNVTIADAKNNYPTSLIVENSAGKDPATKALLQQLFPGAVVTGPSGTAEAQEATGINDNFVVILGQNYASSNISASNTGSTN